MERFAGLGSVGLLDAGTKISESVWNISRSVSFIEYCNVARSTDPKEQKRITLQLFKLTFCAMALIIGCILLIPEWIYTDYLFSPEFKGMRKVICGLSAFYLHVDFLADGLFPANGYTLEGVPTKQRRFQFL